jgi:hypothetical protein
LWRGSLPLPSVARAGQTLNYTHLYSLQTSSLSSPQAPPNTKPKHSTMSLGFLSKGIRS